MFLYLSPFFNWKQKRNFSITITIISVFVIFIFDLTITTIIIINIIAMLIICEFEYVRNVRSFFSHKEKRNTNEDASCC